MENPNKHMTISMIAAMSVSTRVIGANGDIPRRIKEDRAYFKRMTLEKTIVMGRGTYESIGKPLPKRRNIVVSRSMDVIDGVEIVRSFDELFDLLKDEQWDVMIIWWQSLYTAMLPYTSTIYLTEIQQTYQWDTFFPVFESWFTETKRESHDWFDFVTYTRNEL